jgi:DNA-binding MarR family transcriptional regulator
MAAATETQPPSAHPSDDQLATLVVDLRVLIGKLRRRMRETSSTSDPTRTSINELSPSHVNALARLERDGPASVTSLANAEGVRPQSMGATVAVLQAAGFVSSAPHPRDGRQTILSLTPEAREIILSARSAKEDWLSRAILANLTAEEQQQLATGVDLLKRLADS